jgi:hypothetical protein
VRISKLAKILGLLESKKEFLTTCDQIEELIKLEENQIYVQKSFSRLAGDFEQVFYGLPGKRDLSSINSIILKTINELFMLNSRYAMESCGG